MKTLMMIPLWLVLLLPAVACGAQTVVPLHADMPDTLNAQQVSRLELFPDLTGVDSVWFEREAWGGIIAHIKLHWKYLEKNQERSVPSDRWLEMRQAAVAVLAGEDPEPSRFLQDEELYDEQNIPQPVQAWPEFPVRNRTLPEELRAENAGPHYPSMGGQWLVNGGVGYQHNISSYGEYFTDMAVFHLGFARALSNNIIPCGGFTVGLGDLTSEYENLVGDGRGSNYSAMVGVMLRAPTSRKTSVYAAGQGGYFRRSMQWGGLFTDPETGDRVDGYARESGGWGFSAQLGLLRQKSHASKARYFDFNIGLMWGEADPWQDIGPDAQFSASGNDTWLMFTFRFWDQI